MPSKIQLDENLWFLYICLQKSDLKTIDFAAVGEATNLKSPAARMRYTRLRRQIESGTLIGTHGAPFAGSTIVEKNAEATKKRKRASDIDSPPVKPDMRTNTNLSSGLAQAKEEKMMVKEEISEESYFESESESEGNSEDEIPLAKLRKVQMAKGVEEKSIVSSDMRNPTGVAEEIKEGMSLPCAPELVGFNSAFLGNGRLAWGYPDLQWMHGPGYFPDSNVPPAKDSNI